VLACMLQQLRAKSICLATQPDDRQPLSCCARVNMPRSGNAVPVHNVCAFIDRHYRCTKAALHITRSVLSNVWHVRIAHCCCTCEHACSFDAANRQLTTSATCCVQHTLHIKRTRRPTASVRKAHDLKLNNYSMLQADLPHPCF
jgi:hypothetical protein